MLVHVSMDALEKSRQVIIDLSFCDLTLKQAFTLSLSLKFVCLCVCVCLFIYVKFCCQITAIYISVLSHMALFTPYQLVLYLLQHRKS